MLKKIPTWYLVIVIFSKNWNPYSKSQILAQTWKKNFFDIIFFSKFFLLKMFCETSKITAQKDLKFFFAKSFVNSVLVIRHVFKIVLNSYFSVFWKNHYNQVPSGDFFEHTPWFYIATTFIWDIFKACPNPFVWTLAVACCGQ